MMTDREKLVELLAQRCEIQSKGCVGCKSNWPGSSECKQERFGAVADHLIAHGVTVRQMQKPLTVEEATGTLDIVWFEQKHGYTTHPCNAVIGADCENVSMATIGYSFRMLRPIKDYGKTWRCWAEKPTVEEREAAEWER